VATNTDISSQIALCNALLLTPQQMVMLCDRAIAELLLGKPQASYSIAGRSITFSSLSVVQQVRAYYIDAPNIGAPSYVMQPAEF